MSDTQQPDNPVVSIIICTRDHGAALRETLASLATVHIPADLSTELIVADNGSKDDTIAIVRAAKLPTLTSVVVVTESRPGKVFALNAGMDAAKGKIILFTDDDLRFPSNWIEEMCRPILAGEADAISGGVRLAPHLLRPWMTTMHRTWLASTEDVDPKHPLLVGANMSFGRHVMERVPAFDDELGPGLLGFGEDSLFAEQLMLAGYKILPRLDVSVEHHCDADRLQRANFHAIAKKMGRCAGYMEYHWYHGPTQPTLLKRLKTRVMLALRRLQRRSELQGEGVPDWELKGVFYEAFLDQLRTEMRRPRQYDRQGLVKHETSSS